MKYSTSKLYSTPVECLCNNDCDCDDFEIRENTSHTTFASATRVCSDKGGIKHNLTDHMTGIVNEVESCEEALKILNQRYEVILNRLMLLTDTDGK